MKDTILTNPKTKDLEALFSLLRVQGTNSPGGQRALRAIEFVLQKKNLLPTPPERASERAMRLNQARRANGEKAKV